MQNFDRRKAFQLKLRIQRSQRPQHVRVIAERQRRMQPADNVQFRNTEVQRFTCFLNNLIDRKLKTIRIALLPRKGTELATQNAVVGIVDIAVDNIARAIADFSLPCEVGDSSHGVQILALEQAQRIGFGNSRAGGNLLIKVPQCAALDEELHEI